MDTDSAVMKFAIAVIVVVLTYFVYKWWQGQSVEKMEAPLSPSVAPMAPPQQDPVPQEAGIIMYGNNECPWCTKQKDYFANKKMEYKFVDCSTPGSCPNFVHGFPTIVKDGAVMPGYQEL